MKYIRILKKREKKNTMTQNWQLAYYHTLKLHDCILHDRVSQWIKSVDKKILKTKNKRDKLNEPLYIFKKIYMDTYLFLNFSFPFWTTSMFQDFSVTLKIFKAKDNGLSG